MNERLKKLICFIFGHKLVPVYKTSKNKVKYYRCSRCGERVSVTEVRGK